MATPLNSIDPALADFLRAQHVFFVATAPPSPHGHINLSPKGLDTFAILDPRTVAYLDLTGSGVETIAHLKENARIVLMFCAFDGPPKIVRIHGTGRAIEAPSSEFEPLAARFPARPGARAIIRIDVARVAVSCGFGVPLMDFKGERPALDDWSRAKGDEGVRDYQRKKNAISLDGLPGLSVQP